MRSIKVVSDLVCPWCYIGKRRLEAALGCLEESTGVSVSWHPFQLNPDLPSEGMDRREYCNRKFGSWARCEEMFERISEVGKTVGIEFRFEKQLIVPNTLNVHRVIWLGGRQGVQDGVVEALFRAYFCEGVDLSRDTELVDVVAEAGLEKRLLQRFLSADEGLAEVLSEEQEVKALGISSVPLFIMADRVAVSGAQPTETLVAAYRQATHELQPAKAPASKHSGRGATGARNPKQKPSDRVEANK